MDLPQPNDSVQNLIWLNANAFAILIVVILWKLLLITENIVYFSIVDDSATHDDSEDKNLSWLYNYKCELPHLSPEINRSRTETGLQVDKLIQEATLGESDNSDQKSPNEQHIIENPVNT